MKSTHDPFEVELRDRLRHYTEEPDKDLWKGIAIRIVSVNPGSGQVVWTRISTVIVILSFLFSGYQPVEHAPAIHRAITDVPQASNDCILQGSGSSGNVERERVVYASNGQGDAMNRYAAPLESNTLVLEINDPSTFALDRITEEEKEADPGEEMPPILSGSEPPSMILNDSIGTISTIMESPNELKKEKQQKKKSRIKKIVSFKNPTLYFTVMPTFGYQRIEPNTYDKTLIENIVGSSAFSSKRLGVSIELGSEWPLGKKLKVFSGLLYYHQNQTISYTEKQLDNTIVIPGPTPGEFIVEPVYSDVPKSIEYELKNLGVHVGLIYKVSRIKDKSFRSELEGLPETTPLQRKKFVHWVGIGIEFHKALNKTSESNGFYNPTAYVFGNIYYRLQYPNVGRLKAILQPTLNYSFFVNQDLNTSFYVKPYVLGLNIGCTYSF